MCDLRLTQITFLITFLFLDVLGIKMQSSVIHIPHSMYSLRYTIGGKMTIALTTLQMLLGVPKTQFLVPHG